MTAPQPLDERTEWLEADGLGGYASGTTAGLRTRRYHALLLTATTPPTGRMALVNGLDAWVERPGQAPEYLTRQRYAPDLVAPHSGATLERFAARPWPAWRWRLADGTVVEHELFVPRGLPLVALRWRVVEGRRTGRLRVRPFLSGRDSHGTHHENPAFRFEAETLGERTTWRPYPGVPGVTALGSGAYEVDPQWYRRFVYAEEQARGLDAEEDLAAPGVFTWELPGGDAILLLSVEGTLPAEAGAAATHARLRRAERARRERFGSPLELAADAYLVRRGEGRTIVAGYPWFTDWGRDTFIALRGLCIATGRLADARSILLEWAGHVSEGMLPNRFGDQGDAPEYNTVDASLWYVVAVHDYLRAVEARGRAVPPRDRRVLADAVTAILAGHVRGTRYGIRAAEDGLLAAGEPGVQLTWMDAKVGDWVVTPRIGKPVEIQTLWLNALRAAEAFTGDYRAVRERGWRNFAERFTDDQTGGLHDVVDADHVAGRVDSTVRPNQIFAVGGLPWPLLEGRRARQVVDLVEARLLTPLGLRTLTPDTPGYRPRYEGGVLQRDGAYHQGTVWPWLMGAFVEAWVRVRGDTDQARQEARGRFLAPLLQHLDAAGLGHISEIADAEPPHEPRGCPWQAWSVGEALRIDLAVLARPDQAAPPALAASGADAP
ncbi:MAG TPA: amylo-alpha-1,6-glucosidase [Gemmatimonadales bacterium]|nr:amylo-alpha-1,6-glucosidase [Gemmatimonadales bacterium]